MSTIQLDTSKLDALIKAFKEIPKARVGILGSEKAIRAQLSKSESLLKQSEKFVKANREGKKELLSDFAAGHSEFREQQTNAEIGAKHEYGIGVPQRSFLRIPLMNHLNGYLEEADAFSPDALKKVLEDRSIKSWVNKIGLIAQEVVQEAFNSGGFGLWKPSNMKYKKNHQTLVETQQLRNSITSEVVKA